MSPAHSHDVERRNPPPITQEQWGELVDYFIKLDARYLAIDERMNEIENRHGRMQERLDHHFVEEHRDFNVLLKTVNSSKLAIRILVTGIIGIAGVIATLNAVWEWSLKHLTVK